jgi:hypothetical protein
MVENHPDIRKQEYRGIACLVLSAFCFALMSMFVHLAGDLPSMQKSFFRNLVAGSGCFAFAGGRAVSYPQGKSAVFSDAVNFRHDGSAV